LENTLNQENYRPRKYVFEVGQIYPTNHWGEVEVLDVVNSNNIRIKFLNTGNTKSCRSSDLSAGNVRDDKLYKKQGNPSSIPSPAKDKSFIHAGTVFLTNLYGEVVVVEYVNGKNIIIKFTNTGNIQTVQKDALKKGLVHDIKERNRISKEKEKQRKLSLKLQKEEKKKNTLRKRQEKKEAKKAEAVQKRAEKRKLKDEELLSVVGLEFSDKLEMKFSIVSRDLETELCTIRYEESGNEYEFTFKNIVGGQYDVYDRGSSDFEKKYKQYSKTRSVNWYEENRERLLEKALKYQKDNPDKANHYNRIRRGKRKNTEGTHTQEEVIELLVQQDNKCACCNTSFLTVKKHLDHIHPINLGGSNWITNLQWLCDFCNLVKNDSHPDVWLEYSQSEEFKERRMKRLLTV
jgi:5-methylcytosine-specific restriction endonuclease McrA